MAEPIAFHPMHGGMWPFFIGGLAVSPAMAQTTYSESEPNNDFPPSFLPGNPLFQSGDRLAGTIAAGDTDDQYLRVAGGAAGGLFRYTFTLNNPASDHLLDVYDTTSNGFFLGSNNDGTFGLSNRVVFDEFDVAGENAVFGIGLLGSTDTTAYDYPVTVERSQTPVIGLGTLSAKYAAPVAL